jgi:hypothetical protein
LQTNPRDTRAATVLKGKPPERAKNRTRGPEKANTKANKGGTAPKKKPPQGEPGRDRRKPLKHIRGKEKRRNKKSPEHDKKERSNDRGERPLGRRGV